MGFEKLYRKCEREKEKSWMNVGTMDSQGWKTDEKRILKAKRWEL